MNDPRESELHVPLLQDAVLDSLRERLLDGTFPPGSQLNIREVAARLGVSAVPVREAIKILQSEGRLVHERGKGYHVRRLSHEEMVQVNQLSAMIEDELLAAGVPKMTPQDKTAMVEAAEAVTREGGDKRKLLAAHRRLHFIPFEASGLNIFLDVVNRLWDQYEHYRLLFFDSDMAFKSSAIDEHRRFARACVDGDTELARRIHAQHRMSSFRHLARIADE